MNTSKAPQYCLESVVKKVTLHPGDWVYTGLRNGRMGWRRVVAGHDGTRGLCGLQVNAAYVVGREVQNKAEAKRQVEAGCGESFKK